MKRFAAQASFRVAAPQTVALLAGIVLLGRPAPSLASEFDIAQCPLAPTERIFIYQNEQTQEVLGCFRINKLTCELTLIKGKNPLSLIEAMQTACREAKAISS